MSSRQDKGKQPQRETIEIEDDDSQPGPGSGESLSDLLARVQAFLPELQASNAVLAEKAAMDPVAWT
ncbi:hypothetical protein B0H17DRAFT_1204147 [Mycena rosella]|uniref:Uncharacterized protein n=1 Tax=Mycena rosella TaxID=1033263 RepID=A0AAD7DDF5_MYCRO|nr:hypothetical protein B0H17DRAFT_1204147 [Mycena rosella]